MLLFQEDFYRGFFDVGEAGSNAEWFFYTNEDFVGRDPEARLSVLTKRLAIKIPQYSLTTEGFDDHIKYLFFVNAMDPKTGIPGFPVPGSGALRYEVRARFRQIGTEKNPFGARNDDFRLSSGALVAVDFETGVFFGFLLTGTAVYVYYARMPRELNEETASTVFAYVIPVRAIEEGSEHLYRMVYHPENSLLSWVIDQDRVFETASFGTRLDAKYAEYRADHGGEGSGKDEMPAPPRHLAFGVGMMTMLDAGMPDMPALLDVSDPDARGVTTIFGQGGEMVIGTVRIIAR